VGEVAAVARHDEIALATKPTACAVYMLSRAPSDAVHWPLARCHEVVGLKPTIGVISSLAVMLNATLVGSRTGAILRRFSLSVAPRFLWECLISQTVSWVPAPATSNPSCRFPAMGLPARFRPRVMWLTRLAGLSAVTMVGEAGNRCRVPAPHRATAYSTSSNRVLIAPERASDVPESSSLPSL